jgi:hypothetical protein
LAASWMIGVPIPAFGEEEPAIGWTEVAGFAKVRRYSVSFATFGVLVSDGEGRRT